jgi:hypothetical protein
MSLTTATAAPPVALPTTAEPAPAPPPRAARRYEYHAIYLVLSLVVLALAATMSVRGETQVVPPLLSQPLPELCHSRRFFGIDCPGCGMTRCFISLAHGDLAAAWHYNPGGILLFGMLLIQLPYRTAQLWRLARGRAEWAPRRLTMWFSVALATALIGQWLWKMIV